MEKLDATGTTVSGRFGAFMAGKPLWAFLIVYTILAGLGFGLLYTLMYLLLLRWWGAAITVLAIGAIWGFSAHRVSKGEMATE